MIGFFEITSLMNTALWSWKRIRDTFLEDVPLGGDDGLDEDAEEEEESLIHGGEIHTSVETDEEHQLDQEAGVDEDVGDPGADSDGDARGWWSWQCIWESKWWSEQETWKISNIKSHSDWCTFVCQMASFQRSKWSDIILRILRMLQIPADSAQQSIINVWSWYLPRRSTWERKRCLLLGLER